jgi:DNA repair protein RadC
VARRPDPARAKRVLGKSRGRASLDRCARRDLKVAGNPAHKRFEDTTMATLYVRDGDLFRVAGAQDVLDRAQALIAQRFRTGAPVLSAPNRTREFLRLKLGGLDHEVFSVLFLDNRHRLIEYVELFRGTIDGASVHPREVVKEALARNAAALILAHVHPSGVASPSHADEQITQRLREALALVEIRVLDHFVIGETIVSMAEMGIL